MDKRKEELEKKRQKLAELRKAREERKTPGSTSLGSPLPVRKDVRLYSAAYGAGEAGRGGFGRVSRWIPDNQHAEFGRKRVSCHIHAPNRLFGQRVRSTSDNRVDCRTSLAPPRRSVHLSFMEPMVIDLPPKVHILASVGSDRPERCELR
jgi:hypothetical protein